MVSRLQIQVGQRLSPGQTIMTIVPIDKLYVDANFKEGQLGRVRPGMAVTLKSDLYGGVVVYHGKVTGLAGGTGSSMAIIPAQNATGNWIKTVQRLPVRIDDSLMAGTLGVPVGLPGMPPLPAQAWTRARVAS